MISAAEAQLVGWPLPAAVVDRIEWILSFVALSARSVRISLSVFTGITIFLQTKGRGSGLFYRSITDSPNERSQSGVQGNQASQRGGISTVLKA
jgi:hypothetical protein